MSKTFPLCKMRPMTKPKRSAAKLDFGGDGVWLTVAKAAEIAGVTPRTIRNALEAKPPRLLNKQHARVGKSQRMALMVLSSELEGVRFRPCKQPKRSAR